MEHTCLGLGVAVCGLPNVDIDGSLSIVMDNAKSNNETNQLRMAFSLRRSESFSTSDDPGMVGEDADVLLSPALNFYITQGTAVRLNATTCTVQTAPVDAFNAALDEKVRESDVCG